MKIVFQKIKYKNIMSVGQQPVEICLNNVSKTLITGKNGSAKSTMLESLYFALFGKPFRDIKKAQLVNSINKKNLLVELWFTADNNEYYIKRGQKPNVFEVSRNGENLEEAASSKDFQNILEEMIGMNSTSFKQTAILGTAGYVPFMQLKTPERRTLVEDLLDVSILGNMDKLNKTYIRELTQNISSLESNINYVEQQIRTHEDYIAKQKAQMESSADRYKDSYNAQLEKVKKTKEELESLKDELNNIILPEQPIENQTVNDNINKLMEAKFKCKAAIDNTTKVINLYDKGGNCPTCKQELNGDCSSAKLDLDNYNKKYQAVIDKHNQLSDIKNEFNKTLSVYNETVNKFNNMQNRVKLKESELRNFVESAKNIKDMMNKEVEQVDIDYTELNKLKEDRIKLKDKKSSMILEKYNRGFITDMLKDSGIKAGIIKRYIPYFNSRIQYYLEILGADYVFTLDENFNETIKSRGREEFSYYSFSQGEKARIDIALLMCWVDVSQKVSGSSCNILILDEIFDGACDAEAVNNIQTILDSIDKNVFVISHRDHDPQNYGQHLQMIKKGRFSECITTLN